MFRLTEEDYIKIADVIKKNRFGFRAEGIRSIAELFEKENINFNKKQWFSYIDCKSKNYFQDSIKTEFN